LVKGSQKNRQHPRDFGYVACILLQLFWVEERPFFEVTFVVAADLFGYEVIGLLAVLMNKLSRTCKYHNDWVSRKRRDITSESHLSILAVK
jgi:hypothetical protein